MLFIAVLLVRNSISSLNFPYDLAGKTHGAHMRHCQEVAHIASNYTVLCNGLWSGDFKDFEDSPKKISLVISLCQEDLRLLNNAAAELSLHSATVYSKCGREQMGERFLSELGDLPGGSRVINLPNVGRIDHTIAYHISNLKHGDDDEVTLFLKDSVFHVHQLGWSMLPFETVVATAAGPFGFACVLKPGLNVHSDGKQDASGKTMSIWHDSYILQRFHMTEYDNHKYGKVDLADFKADITFSQWLESLDVSFPSTLVPVCYGGNFAAKTSNMLRSQNATRQMVRSLSRGDNIEEGHFAERTWASLIMSRVPLDIMKQLQCMVLGIRPVHDMVGSTVGCDTQCTGASVLN